MGIAADFVLIVLAGLAGGLIARALRLPLLVGYILAGVAVGPHTAGPTVTQIKDIETLAEIGVALLLFSIGLEVSFRDLRVVRSSVLLGGPLQIVLTIFAVALVAVYGLALPFNEAVWLGAMISVSSTMVVIKMLASEGVLSTLSSRLMIGLLLVQDLAIIPMLIVLPQLQNPANLGSRLAGSLLLAGALLALLILAGTRLLPPLLRRTLAWGSRELFLVAVVAIGVGVGWAMHAAGYSFAVGAFMAGLILSESEFRHQALSDVIPLRDIFGLLFFVSVGMLFDPRVLLEQAVPILIAVCLILAGKAVILAGITWGLGYRGAAPLVVGLGLSQIGEFSFVLARSGLATGMLSKQVYDLALTATVITMAVSPLLSAQAVPLALRLREWLGAFREQSAVGAPSELVPTGLSGHVVVGGYGRTGQDAARSLREAGIPLLIVESNHALLAELTAAGYEGLWGDIVRHEIQHAAGVEQGRMLILTMPHQNTVDMALEQARQLNPELIIIARSTRAHHLPRLRALGVSVAVQPEFEGGLEMVRQGLTLFGREEEEVQRIVGRLRQEIYSASPEAPRG